MGNNIRGSKIGHQARLDMLDGRIIRANKLIGVVQTQRVLENIPMTEVELADFEKLTNLIKATIGNEEFQRHIEEGKTLMLEDTLTIA